MNTPSLSTEVHHGFCDLCNHENVVLDNTMFGVFHEEICTSCKWNHDQKHQKTGTSEKRQSSFWKHSGDSASTGQDQDESTDHVYGLITQTFAKDYYLVAPSALQALPFLEKENPRNAHFAKLKLYLRKHVQRLAYERFKGPTGFQDERQRRKVERYERGVKRTQKALQSEQVKKRRAQAALNRQRAQPSLSHKHQFTKEYPVDDSTDKWIKECSECQLKVEFERM